MLDALLQKISETSMGAYVLTKMNYYCDYIAPPPLEKPPQRNVLIISAHPVHDSLNGALLISTRNGLQDAGHDVRVRRLYFDPSTPEENYNGGTFPPLMQPHELRSYTAMLNRVPNAPTGNMDEDIKDRDVHLAREVYEAIEDMRWCNAVVLIYPTWWGYFPAVLKGYFDRVLMPGVAFKLPGQMDKPDMVPLLSHITRVAVVTTYSQSKWKTILYGDVARRWVSSTLRSFFSPDCTLTWRGIYNVNNAEDLDRNTKEPTNVNSLLTPEVLATADIFRHF